MAVTGNKRAARIFKFMQYSIMNILFEHRFFGLPPEPNIPPTHASHKKWKGTGRPGMSKLVAFIVIGLQLLAGLGRAFHISTSFPTRSTKHSVRSEERQCIGGTIWSVGATHRNNNEDDEDVPQGDSPDLNPALMFEKMVHSITGDSSYKFGDLSKKALTELTGKDLDEESYEFGDISRGLITQAGRAVTGNEEYQLGDITRAKLQELEEEMGTWVGENLNALPNNLFRQTFGTLTPQQRRELIIAGVRLAAIALLSWGFATNIASAGVVSMAWMRTVWILDGATNLPMLPLFWSVDETSWRTFLASYATIRLVLDPVLLILRGCCTLFVFRPYARFIATIESKWTSTDRRERYPLLARAFALVTAFTLNNVLIPTLLVTIGLGLGTSVTRTVRHWFPLP